MLTINTAVNAAPSAGQQQLFVVVARWNGCYSEKDGEQFFLLTAPYDNGQFWC